MSFTTQELQDYWTSVKEGSVLSNAAPNSFEGSGTFSPDMSSDLQDIRDSGFMDRQAAMDFSDRYKYDPEQAQMLSERLSGVLASDSPYIQRARTKATEAAGSRGLLNSSMAAGAAEGAAIDRGLQVAQGDVDVDKFNVGNINEANSMRYQAATDIGGRTQEFLNQLGGNESDYLFDVGLANEKQQDALETQQKEFENKLALQDDTQAYQMEQDMLKYTNERAMEMLKQESSLYAAYLSAYGEIAMSDISVADKNNQLQKLGEQIDNAVLAAQDYKDIQITGDNLPQFNITGV